MTKEAQFKPSVHHVRILNNHFLPNSEKARELWFDLLAGGLSIETSCEACSGHCVEAQLLAIFNDYLRGKISDKTRHEYVRVVNKFFEHARNENY